MKGLKIAPRNLVWDDYRKLLREHRLKTTEEVEDLLFVQTIEGHSHNGHSAFQGGKFVDTTITDILEALGKDPFIVRAARQGLIDEIYDYVLDESNLYTFSPVLNKNDEPLIRAWTLKEVEVRKSDVIKGLYLGGLMDDFETRQLVNKTLSTNLGGGRNYIVNLKFFSVLDIDGEKLAHDENGPNLEKWKQIGFVVDNLDNSYFLKNTFINFMYIRHKKGEGISDDLAVIAGGRLYNLGVAIGVYLADAIDTLDKFSLKFFEQDYKLSKIIEKKYPSLTSSKEEIMKFIYLTSIPEGMSAEIPDSSQRYLLEIFNQKTNFTALDSHINYILNKPYEEVKIAFEQIPNKFLYDFFEKRFNKFINNA